MYKLAEKAMERSICEFVAKTNVCMNPGSVPQTGDILTYCGPLDQAWGELSEKSPGGGESVDGVNLEHRL